MAVPIAVPLGAWPRQLISAYTPKRRASSGTACTTTCCSICLAFSFEAVHQDIVPKERIVTTYEMHMGDARISVSLSTVEFKPDGAGTRLRYTEQGAFLDGHDTPEVREHGTRELLDALGAVLEREPVAG